jgi:ribosomal protein S18 acetylase RimI-like enzyme
MVELNDGFNGVGCTVDSMTDALANSTNEIVYAAVADDIVVGFICGLFWHSVCYADGHQGIVSELIVNENYRRNGIATKLIKALEAEFKRIGVREVIIETPVSNAEGRGFYESCGYVGKTAMKYEKSLDK